MTFVRSATITYEREDGYETIEDVEAVFDEETAHWQLRPESGTVIRIPRERVHRVSGGPDESGHDGPDASDDDGPDASDGDGPDVDRKPASDRGSDRETDEYGHPQ